MLDRMRRLLERPVWADWRERLRRLRGPIVAVAGVGAVLSGLAGYWTTWRTVKQAAAPTPVEVQEHAVLSVMVLPFRMLGGEPGQAYIAEGLASGVTQDLGRIRDAFVLPATSAYGYRDTGMAIPALARAAGVRFVLTGDVQLEGQRLRVLAQMVDGGTGRQLWSDSFDGDLTRLFELQGQITARIANSAERRMVVTAAAESHSRRSSPQAADLGLRLRALWLQPASLALQKETEQVARRWLAADPDDVRAIAALAQTLLDRSNFRSAYSGAEMQAAGREAAALAEKATALDASDPWALLVRAEVTGRGGDGAGARRLYERAVELDPKNRVALNQLGLMTQQVDPDRALQWLRQGLALDPKHPEMFELNIGTTLLMKGEYAEALAMGERCAATHPDFAYCPELMAAAHAMLGHEDQARLQVARVLKLVPNYRMSREWTVTPQATDAVRERMTASREAMHRLGMPD